MRVTPGEQEQAKVEDGLGAAEPVNSLPPSPAVETPRKGNPLRNIAVFVAFLILALFWLSVFMERRTPISSQATVQAYIVGITPEVSGKVVDIPISDNSFVKSGDVLFKIDPEQFDIAVRDAEAKLARVGQSLGVSVANVDAAQARLVEARAALDFAKIQANRSGQLVKSGATTAQRADADASKVDQLTATVATAEADLRRAREELGPAGNENPQIREALAALARANLDVIRATVKAPSDGVVTNLQLTTGTFAGAGQNALTFIDTNTVWVAAAFKENSLENLRAGNRAAVVFDILPGQVFPAKVESVGLGVAQGSVDPKTGLPKVSEQSGWLRTPQNFPVKLTLDDGRPKGVLYGSQAHVVIYTGDNPITNAVGKFAIWATSYLTYLN